MGYTSETTVMFPGKTFKINVVEDVDYLLDLVETDDDVPFWAVLWPAALGMAEYFWENTSFGEKRILELGAGLGLVGIVAAAKGAEVVQTDFIPEALQLAEENAKINHITKIERVLADWRKFPLDERFDLIIGSDILYEPTLHPFLKEIFLTNLKPGGQWFLPIRAGMMPKVLLVCFKKKDIILIQLLKKYLRPGAGFVSLFIF